MSENSRTALITGASRGLGLALARRLADDGWNLVIDGRDAEALEEARADLSKSANITAISGDVSDESHRLALAEAAKNFGGLDALVSNASMLGPSPQPELMDYPLETLEEVYRVNVFAPLALIKAVELKSDARIINITSDAATQNYEGWGGYGSSKAALDQLSNILAAENPSLRVYAADPGDMRTRMHQEAFPDEDISDRPLPEESVPGIVRLLTGDLPSGRYEAWSLPDKQEAIHELRVAITADDFEAARKFYEEGFGLPVADEWSGESGKGVILAAPMKTTIEILDRAQSAFVDEIEAGGRGSGHVRLALEADDVDELAKSLEGRGAKPVGEAVETPWGDFNRRLEAPDGLQLTLFHPIEEKETV